MSEGLPWGAVVAVVGVTAETVAGDASSATGVEAGSVSLFQAGCVPTARTDVPVVWVEPPVPVPVPLELPEVEGVGVADVSMLLESIVGVLVIFQVGEPSGMRA